MKAEELFREIKDDKIRPVYYLYGDDSFLKDESFAKLKEVTLKGSMPDFNYDLFYAGEVDVSKVISAAMTLPMMSRRRLVVLKDADRLKTGEQEELTEYLENLSPMTSLVFVGTSVDKRKKFFSILSKAGALVEHSHPFENEMPRWIRWVAKKKGLEISDGAARCLIDIVGNDLNSVANEVEKAALYVGGRKRIELEDVEAVTVETKTKTVFQLTDAMATKNLKDSLKYLKKLMEGGESPILILNMIVRQLRLIWTGLDMKNRGAEEAEIRKRVKIPPFVFKSYMRQIRFFKEDELAKAFGRLSELDVKFKSSRIDKERALELFMFELCGQVERGLDRSDKKGGHGPPSGDPGRADHAVMR